MEWGYYQHQRNFSTPRSQIPPTAWYARTFRLRHCILSIWSWEGDGIKGIEVCRHTGLYAVIGEEGSTLAQLMEAGRKFICSLCGIAEDTDMSFVRYTLYSRRTRGKAVSIKTLPPTDGNLTYHILRAHYQVMLWKAANQQSPPVVDMTDFGWEFNSGTDSAPSPCIARGPAAPPALMDVINCQCKAVGKACITMACSCHSAGLSCTPYCFCAGETMCINPFTKHENATDNDDVDSAEEVDDVDVEDAGRTD